MTRPYQPRDVINAPDIKARIVARSAARGDTAEIAAWLANHFYRHVIGNFTAPPPAVQAIDHWREVQARIPTPAPDWARAALVRLQDQFKANPHASAGWWIEADSAALLTLEARLLEFLHARRGTALQGKLQRITCPQALARWALEHQAFSQQRALGLVQHQADAVQPLLQGEHGVFVEFDRASPHLRMELAWESAQMRHCLGQFHDRTALAGGYGEHYASACEEGRMRLFSYRSGNAHPHITVSAHVHADGRVQIDQIKGKQNRPPVERYHDDVLLLLNYLQTDAHIPPDAHAIALLCRPEHLRQNGAPAWCRARDLTSEAECLWLLGTYPKLLDLQHVQTPLMQWLIAAQRDQFPESVHTHLAHTEAVRAALALAEQEPAA